MKEHEFRHATLCEQCWVLKMFTDAVANQSVQLFVLGSQLLERSLAISAENGRRPAESCHTVHGVSETGSKGN